MHASGTGIGRALQRAREVRGKSLEEASRETRIRAEYLKALEQEAFDRLRGDVYARGFLRSYSSYLGLDADKVLTVYGRTHGKHRPPPGPPVQPSAALGGSNGHPAFAPRTTRWGLAGAIAVAIFLVVGVVALTRRGATPAPQPVPTVPAITASTRPVVVDLTAFSPVEGTITVDGEVVFRGSLAKDEARSFEGARSISLSFESGALVAVTVNGAEIGAPGEEGVAWEQTFGPEDFRSEGSANGP